MGARSAVTRILTCDAPDCPTIIVPEIHKKTLRPGEREGRWLLLSFNVDAFAASRAAGWVTSQGKDYCPTHVHLAPRRVGEPDPTPSRTTPRTPAAMTPTHGMDDVPLPGMPADA